MISADKNPRNELETVNETKSINIWLNRLKTVVKAMRLFRDLWEIIKPIFDDSDWFC